MKKIKLLLLFFSMLTLIPLEAQRKMETLDRGLVAVKVTNGVFLSWRMPGDEWYNVTYNVYRNGTKINNSPLEVSNYSDSEGTLASQYTISAIVNGTEQDQCSAVTPLSDQYKEIKLKPRNTDIYQINDATTADLDGDGVYEIIIKRLNTDYSEGNDSAYTYFEAYKMDGSLMWEMNVGPNILSSGGVEINIAAFDFDEDGKAEVFLRTSEGTIFADGTKIGDTNGDGTTNYRYSVNQSANMNYLTEGPEFLSLVDGETGVELDRVDFIPRTSAEWWGDGYGHRANKFFFGAPYLDGIHPSLFIGRGIYTKTIMRTYDVVNKKLIQRWEFRATESSDPFYGEGNHNYTVADVDGDGRDEIVWGGMTVDDDGEGLYSTDLGHGDALHVGDLDPYRKGTEIWRCLENSPMYGTYLCDGATGKILIHDILGRDCGRCCAANISDDIKGKALWGSNYLYSASTKEALWKGGSVAANFRIYWDGDLLEEELDHINFTKAKGYGTGAIKKYGIGDIFVPDSSASCNYTKGTPTLQADLFGDWREEVIWRMEDNTKIRIYTTIDPTIYKNYSLMYDHQYRQAICWQMCGYNQPPHVSYFLGKGENITVPPPPTITNGRLVYNGTGEWDKTSESWYNDTLKTKYSDGTHVLFDISNGDNVSVTLSSTVAPSIMTVNSPGTYTLNATTGNLTGTMNLIKQGSGSFNLNGTHDYSGKTEIWDGLFNFDGTLSNSPVWVNLFGKVSAKGELQKGMVMRYGASLNVGDRTSRASLIISDSLKTEENVELVYDLQSSTDVPTDTIKVKGKMILANKTIIKVNAHLEANEERLTPRTYLLAIADSFVCNVNNIDIKGILGTQAHLKIDNDSLLLIVSEMRNPTSIVWKGTTSYVWDLNNTINFTNNNDDEDIFATGDTVIMDDSAIKSNINITKELCPASVTVNSSKNYKIYGNGEITGTTNLTKKGSGYLSIKNNNSFTGKCLIEEGNVIVYSMPNSIDGCGAIGPVSDDESLFEINGGTLSLVNEMLVDRALYIGPNGGSIYNGNTVKWREKISGNTLNKSGVGNLILCKDNSLNNLIIEGGTVSLYNEEAQPGEKVTFKNGILKCYNNSGTYSSANYPLVVPNGYTGKMYLDSRCSYNETLTGAGTFYVYIPYVRSDLNGDWSDFAGKIYFESSDEGVTCRFNNSYGYEKADINIGSNVYASHLSGSTVKIGALTGTGTMGNATWEIGAKNSDFSFNGTFSDGKINKVGTGTMTLTKASTTSGTVYVKEGTLLAKNSSGSATGTGDVNVSDGAFLGGNGTISGDIKIYSGATLYAGCPGTTGSQLTIGNVTMYNGGYFYVKTNASTCDILKASNKFVANGTLIMNNTGTTAYTEGQSFKIVFCSNIQGSFDNISPTTPGDGLEWDMSDFNNSGKISVVTSSSDLNKVETSLPKLFPNPADDLVYLNIPENSGKITIQIQTINGLIIKQENYYNESQIELNVSSYNKGVYIIKTLFKDKIFTNKLILE